MELRLTWTQDETTIRWNADMLLNLGVQSAGLQNCANRYIVSYRLSAAISPIYTVSRAAMYN